LFDELRNKRLVDQHELWRKVRTIVSKYPFATHLTELTDKLSAWENIREPQRLFETLSLESYAMANLVDVCRNLKDFAEQSLDEYNNIKHFCEHNEENFIHLEASDKNKAEQLKSFLLSDYPVRDFRSYLKLKTELDKAIREKVKALRNETLARYEAIFNDLDALADANQVGKMVFADRGYKLQSIENLKTISLLRYELSNADNFSSKERSKILLEKNKMDQELANKEAQRKRQELINKGEKPDEGPRTPPVAEPISFSLPKADYILSTEAEVDAYLTSIRQQLMHMILSNKKIIIK